MKIYYYGQNTGIYQGEADARLDPAELKRGKEKYMLPGHATFIAVPPPREGQERVFIDGAWTYVEDHRGETVYDTGTGQPLVIALLGEIGSGLTVLPRPGSAYVWGGEGWEFDRATWLDSDIRPRRNQLLDEVDLKYCNAERWDSMTITSREAWAAYKQALRDLPDTIDHDNPVWPVVPG